jgi:two-component system, chemotaxis family, CheB/CheR fusion protein
MEEKRLKRFFTQSNGSYQIAKVIRDNCIFAKQDMTADPPFSNLDLISCRNMLIYFDSDLHEKVVPILHYALKLCGFLVVGASESIGKFTNLFEPLNKKGIIYTKKRAQPSVTFGLQATTPYLRNKNEKSTEKKDTVTILKDEVDRLLVTEYVPAALLVKADLDVLIFRGNVAPYVLPESGLASLNLVKIIRKELRSEVTSAIYRAKKEKNQSRKMQCSLNIPENKKQSISRLYHYMSLSTKSRFSSYCSKTSVQRQRSCTKQ